MPDVGNGLVNAAGLSDRKRSKEAAAFFSGMEKALAAIGMAGALFDIAVVDQLAQHARQALLGDLEDIEKVGDGHARAQIDEIQHPVVGAAEPLTLKNGICVAGEITIGEKEQAHDVERQSGVIRRGGIYVSLVDIYLVQWHCASIAH